MAEIQQRIPEANVPLPGGLITGPSDVAQTIQQEAQQEPTVDLVNMDSILSGQTSMIGDMEVSPADIQQAQAFLSGQTDDSKAYDRIDAMLATYKKRQVTATQRADIPLTKITDEGKRVPDIPSETDDRGGFYGLMPSEKQLMTGFAKDRIKLADTLEAKLVDPEIVELMSDHFRTDFWNVTRSGLIEFGRFAAADIPPFLATLDGTVTQTVFDAWDSDVDLFGEKSNWDANWKANSAMFDKWGNILKEQVGINPSYAKALNDSLKEKYIARHGLDAYEAKFTRTIGEGEDAVSIEIPMVDQDIAAEMVDFGFKQLPASSQVLSYFGTDAPITAGIAFRHLSKGAKQLKYLKDGIKADPMLANLSPVAALRQLRIADAEGKWYESITKFKSNVGSRFGYTGALGNTLENNSQAVAMHTIARDIQDYDKVLNAAKNIDAPDTRMINIRGDKMSLLDAKMKRNQLQARYNRLYMAGAENPYFFNTMVDEAIVANAQAFGYNFITSIAGNEISQDTGAMLGALSSAFGVRPSVRMVKGVATAAARTQPGQVVVDGFRLLEDLPVDLFGSRKLQGLFVNRALDDFERELASSRGRPLTGKERAAIYSTAKLMSNVRPDQREMVLRSIDEYNKMRRRIIDSFPEELRGEAEDAFRLSFAHASGLAPLQAMEKASLTNVNLKNIEQAVDIQLQAENSFRMMQLGVNNLRNLIEKSTGMKVTDRQYLDAWIGNFEKAADGQQTLMTKRRQEYLGLIENYRDNALQNPSEKIDGDTLKTLVNLEKTIKGEGKVLNVEEERNILIDNVAALQNALSERLDTIKYLRGGEGFERRMGLELERLYDIQEEKLRLQRGLIYKNAEESLGDDKFIDMSPAFQVLMDKFNVKSAEDFGRLFSGEAFFARTRSAKDAWTAFNTAGERSIRQQLGFDEDDIAELYARMSQPKLKNGNANPDFIPPQYLGSPESPNYAVMAFHLSTKQADDGEKFIPFMAGAFEADEMKRYFTSMADRTKDETRAIQFTDMANGIEDAITSDPAVAAAVEGARSEYKRSKFDKMRPGSLGDKIDNSRTGPAFEETAEFEYAHPYKPNMQPQNWHKDFGIGIDEILQDKAGATGRLQNSVEEFRRYWGDRVEEVTDADGNVTSQFVFDATTEDGMSLWKALQKSAEASVFSSWGSARELNLQEAIRRAASGQDISEGTYKFGVLSKLNNAQEQFTMYVRTKPGEPPQKLNLVDFGDMFEAEADITDLIGLSKEVRKQFDDFRRTVNGETGNLGELAKDEVLKSKRFQNKMERIAGTSDVGDFFEMYIARGTTSSINMLRDTFVDGLVAEVPNMTRQQAINEFNSGMVVMITNGLLRRAEVAPSGTVTFSSIDGGAAVGYKNFDGTTRTRETMTNASQLVADLENEDTIKILREFMDDEHLQYLHDFAGFMQMAAGTSVNRYSSNGVRSISPNEVISRAFNIARGMVSPTYVGAEFAFRVLEKQKISLVQVAAESKEAAEILNRIMAKPETVTDANVKTLGTILTSIAAREAARLSQNKVSEYIPPEAILAATQYERQEQETYEKAVP